MSAVETVAKALTFRPITPAVRAAAVELRGRVKTPYCEQLRQTGFELESSPYLDALLFPTPIIFGDELD